MPCSRTKQENLPACSTQPPPKCRAPSRQAVNTIFKVFLYDSTRGLNPRSTYCEADALTTTSSHRFYRMLPLITARAFGHTRLELSGNRHARPRPRLSLSRSSAHASCFHIGVESLHLCCYCCCSCAFSSPVRILGQLSFDRLLLAFCIVSLALSVDDRVTVPNSSLVCSHGHAVGSHRALARLVRCSIICISQKAGSLQSFLTN